MTRRAFLPMPSIEGEGLAVLRARFWWVVGERSEQEGCWEWPRPKCSAGYGTWQIPRFGRRFAHRVAWFVENGRDPAELDVLHKCDNPACVRPDHLFLGDANANMQDCSAKKRCAAHREPQRYREFARKAQAARRAQTRCKRGHEFTPENTYLKAGSDGCTHRVCRECRRADTRARVLRTRGAI